MKRRDFLKNSVAGAATVGLGAIAPLPARAEAVTLASVAAVASLGRSFISLIGGSRPDVSSAVALENFRLLLDAHRRLSGIEDLLFATLERIERLREEVNEDREAHEERNLTARVIGIMNSYHESMNEFEVARNTENADVEFANLQRLTQEHLAELRVLRGQLAQYSPYSAMSVVGLVATEISMQVLLGNDPNNRTEIRGFIRDYRNALLGDEPQGSFSAKLGRARETYAYHRNQLGQMLGGMSSDNAAVELATSDFLGRCYSYGFPRNVKWSVGRHGSAGSQGGVGFLPFSNANWRRVFGELEQRFMDNRLERYERDDFHALMTFHYRVPVRTEDHTAAGFTFKRVYLADDPTVQITEGARDRDGTDCRNVMARPHRYDAEYFSHVEQTYLEAQRFNLSSEGLAVLEEYNLALGLAFDELESFLTRHNVPE